MNKLKTEALKIFAVLYCLLFSYSTVYAQELPKAEDLKSVGKAEIEVVYDVSWARSPGSEKRVDDKVHTLAGTNVWYSYSEQEWRRDVNRMRSLINKGKRGTDAAHNLYSNLGEVLVGYPEGKTTVTVCLDAAGVFQYEEKTETPKWELVADSTREVLGYKCLLAKCNFRGRDFKAWYTIDIPLSVGPWKLGGLPGLILEVEEEDYHFIATGIEKKTQSIDMWQRDVRKTTRKKLRNLEAAMLADPDAFLADYGEKLQVFTYDGSVMTLKSFAYDNAIEKE